MCGFEINLGNNSLDQFITKPFSALWQTEQSHIRVNAVINPV